MSAPPLEPSRAPQGSPGTNDGRVAQRQSAGLTSRMSQVQTLSRLLKNPGKNGDGSQTPSDCLATSTAKPN